MREVYEDIYKPVVSECFEIIGFGDIETVDDIERIVATLPVPDIGADHDKIKRFLEAKRLNPPSRKASFVLFPRVAKEYSKEQSMTNKSLAAIVIESLGDFIIQYDEYGENEITMEVQDVNAKVMEMDLVEYIKKVLESNGFISEKIGFNFGDGHWVTVYVKE